MKKSGNGHSYSFNQLTHPLHALVLVVRRLLDAVDVVLEGGVTPGVVLLLLRLHRHPQTKKRAPEREFRSAHKREQTTARESVMFEYTAV